MMIDMKTAIELANLAIEKERARIVALLRQWAAECIEEGMEPDATDRAAYDVLGSAADNIEAEGQK